MGTASEFFIRNKKRRITRPCLHLGRPARGRCGEQAYPNTALLVFNTDIQPKAFVPTTPGTCATRKPCPTEPSPTKATTPPATGASTPHRMRAVSTRGTTGGGREGDSEEVTDEAVVGDRHTTTEDRESSTGSCVNKARDILCVEGQGGRAG